MKSIKSLLHPREWTWTFYLATGLLLVSINLFGPRGLLQWVLVRQQLGRLVSEEEKLNAELIQLKNDLESFKRSRFVKERSIRNVLGYLKKNEGSVEFIEEDQFPNMGGTLSESVVEGEKSAKMDSRKLLFR